MIDCDQQMVDHAEIVAQQVAKRLEYQIAAAVARLMDEPNAEVRIALALVLRSDDGGGMIAAELSMRRTETAEKVTLTPFRFGQTMLTFGDREVG
jgi:hypothetical protein